MPIRKTLMIMRLIILFLVVGFVQVHGNTYAQNISLVRKNISFEQVLREIKKQSGYDFIYDEALIRQKQSIDVNLTNVPIQTALETIFYENQLTYSITDRIVTVRRSTGAPAEILQQQPVTISGTVVDRQGKLMAGASIRIKGRDRGTQAGLDGTFQLRANRGDILVIMFLGYKEQEIQIRDNNRLEITLDMDVERIAELTIISTGYQTMAKERSAGSYAKPDMSIIESRSYSMNVLQRLDGLVPGLTVNNAPMSRNPLLIRGVTTLGLDPAGYSNEGAGTSRSPLFVVDGITMEDVSTINPQDVADITVLKDATAASIWGARASNGVVVIMTKKGAHHEKVKVRYDAFMNFQGRPDLDYIPVMSSSDFIQTAKEMFDPVLFPWSTVSAFTNTGSVGIAPHEVILYNQHRGLITEAQANKSLDSLASISNHQQIRDLFYRNSSIMNHSLSISGGGQVHSFYGSLAYTNHVSPRPGETNDAYKINLRQDFNITRWLKTFLITDLTNQRTSTKRMQAIDYRFFPYQLFQDENGDPIATNFMGFAHDDTRVGWEQRSRIDLSYVPLKEAYSGFTTGDDWVSRITGGLKIDLLKGLSFEGTYGFLKQANKIDQYDGEDSYLVRTRMAEFTVAPTASSTPQYYYPTVGGRYEVANINKQSWTLRNQLLFEKDWSDHLHQLTVLAGQEAQNQKVISNGSLVHGYDLDLQTYAQLDYNTLATNGITNPVIPNNTGRSVFPFAERPVRQTETEIRFTSYYANAGYTYSRKYTVNASWRIDQSNLFGLDKSAQNRPVWSTGLKWMLSEEDFMQDIRGIDHLAVRTTYGITGNSPLPGTAASYDILASQSSGFLPNGRGLRIATASNPKLTWESTRTLNLGLDFTLFNARLSGAFDWYDKMTDNLLGNMTVNSFTGYSSIIGNFGNLKNTGLELSLNSANIRKGDFGWNTFVSLAYNKNTITQLNSPVAITTGAQKVSAQYLTGHPAFAIFAYDFAGLDNLGDPTIRLTDGTTTKLPSASMAEDVLFAGTYQPVWSGGVGNSFRYKALTLTANAVLNLGHVLRRDVGPNQNLGGSYTGRLIAFSNALSSSSQAGFTGGQLHPEFLQRWRKPGDEAFTNVPSYVANQSQSTTRRNTDYYRRADINVESASFIKLRDISLMYRLPQSLTDRFSVEQITLRTQVQNIMLWKANKSDIDPEFHSAPSGTRTPSAPYVTDPSINTYNYRFGQGTFTFGLNVNF